MRSVSVLVVVLCVAFIATAPVAANDHGEKINVQVPYDLDSLRQEAGPVEEPEPVNQEAYNFWQVWNGVSISQDNPHWNANGNIYFMGISQNLFSVLASGGMAELLRPTEEEVANTPVENRLSFTLSSMTQNSTKLYCEKYLDSSTFIDAFEIDTGDIETITEGREPEVSDSGTYLVYLEVTEYPTPWNMVLRNLDTGTETVLDTGNIQGQCFSPDESTIIYSKAVDSANYQLFSIPVTGGQSVQLTTYDGGMLGKMRVAPHMHPNGNLILYTDTNYDEEYQEILNYSSGTGIYEKTTWYPRQLALFNITTGQSTYLFEYDDDPDKTVGEQWGYFTSRDGVFSPDGLQICYSGEYVVDIDKGGQRGPTELYVLDFVAAKYSGDLVVVEEDAPEPFLTIRNFPNPFNPQTTLSFTLPTGGYTEVSVYNLAGQRIRELIATELAPGTHEVVWDGRDMHDMPVSSGVFFSQLKTGDTVVTDRMTLVK